MHATTPPRPLDSAIQIVTPENISFPYQVAGPFQRLPAFLIDLGVRILIALLIISAARFLLPRGYDVGLGLVVFFLSSWFYGALLEAFLNGQTPGKRLLRLRVLSTDGRPITLVQALLRNLLREADLLPLISLVVPTGALGLIVMAQNRRFQRLGDLVAGTMVVFEPVREVAADSITSDPKVHELAARLPPDLKIGRSLSRALAMYLARRKRVQPSQRKRIARHLGSLFIRRLGLDESQVSHDLLLCALYYRAFVADHRTEPEIAFVSEVRNARERPRGHVPGAARSSYSDSPP